MQTHTSLISPHNHYCSLSHYLCKYSTTMLLLHTNSLKTGCSLKRTTEKHNHKFLFVLSITYLSIAAFPWEQSSLTVATFDCFCYIKNTQSGREEVWSTSIKNKVYVAALLLATISWIVFSLKKKRWKTCFRITLLVPPVNGAVGLSFISFRALWPCLPSVHSATTVLFSFASPLDLPLCLLVIQRWKQWKLINRDTQSQKLFQLYCCADTLHLLLDTSTLDFYSSTHSLLTEQHKLTHK